MLARQANSLPDGKPYGCAIWHTHFCAQLQGWSTDSDPHDITYFIAYC